MEIKVCLNGARYSAEHLETPVTSASLAMAAQTLVAAGAGMICLEAACGVIVSTTSAPLEKTCYISNLTIREMP